MVSGGRFSNIHFFSPPSQQSSRSARRPTTTKAPLASVPVCLSQQRRPCSADFCSTCDIGTRPQCNRHISATQTPPDQLQLLCLADKLQRPCSKRSWNSPTGSMKKTMESELSRHPQQWCVWRWLGRITRSPPFARHVLDVGRDRIRWGA